MEPLWEGLWAVHAQTPWQRSGNARARLPATRKSANARLRGHSIPHIVVEQDGIGGGVVDPLKGISVQHAAGNTSIKLSALKSCREAL
jgi:hypothetical protein